MSFSPEPNGLTFHAWFITDCSSTNTFVAPEIRRSTESRATKRRIVRERRRHPGAVIVRELRPRLFRDLPSNHLACLSVSDYGVWKTLSIPRKHLTSQLPAGECPVDRRK